MNPPSILETPVVRSDDSAVMKSETAGLNRADRRKEERAIRIADKKEARRLSAARGTSWRNRKAPRMMRRCDLVRGDVFEAPLQKDGTRSVYAKSPLTVLDNLTEVDEYDCRWAVGTVSPNEEVEVVSRASDR